MERRSRTASASQATPKLLLNRTSDGMSYKNEISFYNLDMLTPSCVSFKDTGT